MKSWNYRRSRAAARTLGLALAVIALVGVADAGAKSQKRERDRDKSHAGYIGVYMQDLTDDVRKGLDLEVKEGVLISGVEDDGPADRAGLDDGDVVVSFNGSKVSTPDELRAAVRAVEPGSEAAVEVVQDGKTRTVTITVGERPDRQFGWFATPDAPEFRGAFAMLGGPRLGIQGHDIDDALGAYFNAKKGDGVLVLEVEEESVAGKAGVQVGDIVQKIGEEKVAGVEDLRESLRDFEEGDEFTITVLRHGKPQQLAATMDERASEFSWAWNGHGPHGEFRRHAPRVNTFRVPMVDQDHLREELDDLREELEQLKEEMQKRAD